MLFLLVLFAVVAALCVAVVVLRFRHVREVNDVYWGPHLYDRISALIEPHEGEVLPKDAHDELEREVEALFRDVLTGVGLVPDDWSIRLDQDPLLGPVAVAVGPNDQHFTLADFERRLRDGLIHLPSA